MVIVGGGAAPQLSIGAALGGAGVVGLAHEHEGEGAWLTIRVASIHKRLALWWEEEATEETHTFKITSWVRSTLLLVHLLNVRMESFFIH